MPEIDSRIFRATHRKHAKRATLRSHLECTFGTGVSPTAAAGPQSTTSCCASAATSSSAAPAATRAPPAASTPARRFRPKRRRRPEPAAVTTHPGLRHRPQAGGGNGCLSADRQPIQPPLDPKEPPCLKARRRSSPFLFAAAIAALSNYSRCPPRPPAPRPATIGHASRHGHAHDFERFLRRYEAANTAFVNGDPSLWLSITADRDPVSIFGGFGGLGEAGLAERRPALPTRSRRVPPERRERRLPVPGQGRPRPAGVHGRDRALQRLLRRPNRGHSHRVLRVTMIFRSRQGCMEHRPPPRRHDDRPAVPQRRKRTSSTSTPRRSRRGRLPANLADGTGCSIYLRRRRRLEGRDCRC